MFDFIGDFFSSIFDAIGSIFNWIGEVLQGLIQFILENPLLLIALAVAFVFLFPAVFPSLTAALTSVGGWISGLAVEWGWGTVLLAGLAVAAIIDPDAVVDVVTSVVDTAAEVIGPIAETVGGAVGSVINSTFPNLIPLALLGLGIYFITSLSKESDRA